METIDEAWRALRTHLEVRARELAAAGAVLHDALLEALRDHTPA